ncbi:MAG: hypothetical protein VW124_15745 [Paracoccaceae bacterium]
MNEGYFLDNGYEEDFVSTPRVITLDNDRDYLQQFIDNIEEFSGTLFHVSPLQADINLIRGNTSVYLTQNEDTLNVIKENSISSIDILGGNHDIFLSPGDLQLSQMSGSSTVYIDDIYSTTANIELSSGSLKLAINDPALELSKLSIVDGLIEVDGNPTGISIQLDETHEYSLTIENLLSGAELHQENLINLNSQLINKPAGDNFAVIDVETPTLSEPGNVSKDIPNVHDMLSGDDIIPELIYQDQGKSTLQFQSYFEETPEFSTHFDDTLSFNQHDLFSENLNAEMDELVSGHKTQKALESLTSPELDDSIAKLDLILEMDGYEALTWEDAVEIISDI